VLIDWTDEYQSWRDRLSKAVVSGNGEALERHRLADFQLELLQELDGVPDEDSVSIKRVRQSRRFPLWRVSHPFVFGIAVRTVVWFPNDQEAVVVAIAGDKARMGDVFYDSVGSRADQAIERYIAQRKAER
jgi:hypothetical protein